MVGGPWIRSLSEGGKLRLNLFHTGENIVVTKKNGGDAQGEIALPPNLTNVKRL